METIIIISLLFSFLVSARWWNSEPTQPATQSTSEVVVIVAPSVNDSYYASVFDRVIAYDINFVNTVHPHIDVRLIVNAATLPYVEGQVPAETIHVATINDIWVRDFAPVFPSAPVKFRYRPNYLRPADARWIEDSFLQLTDDFEIDLTYSDIILDGGNFVHNGVDKAIISNRVFDDNPRLSAAELRQALNDMAGITSVAFIPPHPDDITGHADGQTMWINTNTLLVSEYDEPLRTQVLTPLQSAFPNATIIEVPVDYVEGQFGDFTSACGLHINALATDSLIILPTYNQDNDEVVKATIEANTSKMVVTVDASEVCVMGGAVRCLSWYAKGAEADAILGTAATPTAISLGASEANTSANLLSRLVGFLSVLTVWAWVK